MLLDCFSETDIMFVHHIIDAATAGFQLFQVILPVPYHESL